VIAITLLAMALPVTSMGCFGSFTTLRKVYAWNETVSAQKWVRWGVFLLVGPVYGGATAFDLVFTNAVEFWTGKNPMAAIPGSTRTVLGPNGERATFVMRDDGALDVVLAREGVPEERLKIVPESESLAAYDVNGALVARVGDGPDGEPMLLAGAGVR
jgi:hypothetical protein